MAHVGHFFWLINSVFSNLSSSWCSQIAPTPPCACFLTIHENSFPFPCPKAQPSLLLRWRDFRHDSCQGSCWGTSCLLSAQEGLWERWRTEHTWGFGRGRGRGREEMGIIDIGARHIISQPRGKTKQGQDLGRRREGQKVIELGDSEIIYAYGIFPWLVQLAQDHFLSSLLVKPIWRQKAGSEGSRMWFVSTRLISGFQQLLKAAEGLFPAETSRSLRQPTCFEQLQGRARSEAHCRHPDGEILSLPSVNLQSSWEKHGGQRTSQMQSLVALLDYCTSSAVAQNISRPSKKIFLKHSSQCHFRSHII